MGFCSRFDGCRARGEFDDRDVETADREEIAYGLQAHVRQFVPMRIRIGGEGGFPACVRSSRASQSPVEGACPLPCRWTVCPNAARSAARPETSPPSSSLSISTAFCTRTAPPKGIGSLAAQFHSGPRVCRRWGLRWLASRASDTQHLTSCIDVYTNSFHHGRTDQRTGH